MSWVFDKSDSCFFLGFLLCRIVVVVGLWIGWFG